MGAVGRKEVWQLPQSALSWLGLPHACCPVHRQGWLVRFLPVARPASRKAGRQPCPPLAPPSWAGALGMERCLPKARELGWGAKISLDVGNCGTPAAPWGHTHPVTTVVLLHSPALAHEGGGSRDQSPPSLAQSRVGEQEGDSAGPAAQWGMGSKHRAPLVHPR